MFKILSKILISNSRNKQKPERKPSLNLDRLLNFRQIFFAKN